MGRKKVYKLKRRCYHIPINEYTQNTLQVFKIFRPDLKTYNAIVEYAYEMFFRDFYNGEIFKFEYEMLATIDKDYSRRITYYHLYQEHKFLPKRLNDINNFYKIHINKAEMFRRIIYYMLAKYGLFKYNVRHPFIQEFNIDTMEEFIAELEPEIQAEIRKALASELLNEVIDDKTLEEENKDDKTLTEESIDDKTLEKENIDEDLYIEMEDYDLINWEE